MTAPQVPRPGESPDDFDLARVEQALSGLAYLLTRTWHHEMLTAAAGVPLDRAEVVVLRRLAGTGPIRPGELANTLQVESSHVSRLVRKLTRVGYVKQTADLSDSRAQLVELTDAGREAAAGIAAQARRDIAAALTDWTAADLHQLAGVLQRACHDFVAAARCPAAAKTQVSVARTSHRSLATEGGAGSGPGGVS